MLAIAMYVLCLCQFWGRWWPRASKSTESQEEGMGRKASCRGVYGVFITAQACCAWPFSELVWLFGAVP